LDAAVDAALAHALLPVNSPLRSGSRAWTTPGLLTGDEERGGHSAGAQRIGGEAKSKSGASRFVQLI
jgi:hypothetical protein